MRSDPEYVGGPFTVNLDVENRPSYVEQIKWKITKDETSGEECQLVAQDEPPDPREQCWIIESPDSHIEVNLFEGIYHVSAQSLQKSEGGVTPSGVKRIQVDDILIVAIGDSVASGEGNPPWPCLEKKCELESRAMWVDDGMVPFPPQIDG